MVEQENEVIERSEMSDIDFADQLIGHIVHPCGLEAEGREVANLRLFYLREAKRALETFTDIEAKTKLQDAIQLWGRFAGEEKS
jgi:hypothetical protein